MTWITRCAATALVMIAAAGPVRAADLLEEAVDFTGTILWIQTDVPGLVIGAVRGDESYVAGFGEFRDGSGIPPDGDTRMRIGSVTKVFTGAVLASLVADGTVDLTARVDAYLDWDVTLPTMDGHYLRLIDLATHAGGLPREIQHNGGTPEDPYADITRERFIQNLEDDPLMFPPGTGVFYSNFGFDLLAQTLQAAAGQPYETLLEERVLKPAGMTATTFNLTDAQRETAFQGHNIDGSPMPFVPSAEIMRGSGSLHSTANDLLAWMKWHLDRFGENEAEMRMIDHATYLGRDGLSPIYGMDESGHMDGLGLGWIVMEPEGTRPRILQKAGGRQGIFTYFAFAPDHGVGVFAAMNEFSFGGTIAMNAAMNELIDQLSLPLPTYP